MTSLYNKSKRSEAIAYLRSRNLWILDGKFTPTLSTSTDVSKTWKKFLEEVKK